MLLAPGEIGTLPTVLIVSDNPSRGGKGRKEGRAL